MKREGAEPQSFKENSEITGLGVHSAPPRLLNEYDILETNHFLRRSKRARHRDKIDASPILPYSMLVAKSVSRKDYVNNSAAMDAYWKEWNNLERKGVWRWDELTNWDDAVRYHKANPHEEYGTEVHFGYLFGIMVEKGAEFEVGDPRRYFKYRVVFQGNNVKDQNWQVALFNEMQSTPATLEANRVADIYSCMRQPDGSKHTVETRDVEQAYLQAEMRGPPVYIMLPEELWTGKMWTMDCPVFRLHKALYGHKHSGVFWQEHCHVQATNAGFVPLSMASWPCVYWNKDWKLLLIIYVGDMKLSGPACHMKKAWNAIGQNISLEPQKGDDVGENEGKKTLTFLGCEMTKCRKELRPGQFAECVEYNISRQLRRALAKYEEAVFTATGLVPEYVIAKTPFLEEETKTSPHRAPWTHGEFVECPNCLYTMSKKLAEERTFLRTRSAK